MKRDRHFRLGCLILLLLSSALAGLVIWGRPSAASRSAAEPADNNPQKFHLWLTGGSMSYTFNYDPRAADEWLFRTGGGTLAGDQPPNLKLPTNESERR